MRYVKYLIDQVRKETENEEFGEFTGIEDTEFIQYLNDAQHNLQAMITHQYPNVFVKETIIDITAGQDSYEIPSDCYLGNKLVNVEFSHSGREEEYYILAQDTIKRRITVAQGSPTSYIRMSGKIILNPSPSVSGKLRVHYIQRVRELDLRRAQVNSITSQPNTSSSVSISLLNDNILTDEESLQEHEYVCVVDKLGNTIAKNLPIESISLSNLVIGPHTPASEDMSIENGHYIVGGRDTSTHGDFDRSVERYLIAYCAWKILKRDSSIDSAEAIQELNMMASEIIKSYAVINDDLQTIPEINDWDDWGV